MANGAALSLRVFSLFPSSLLSSLNLSIVLIPSLLSRAGSGLAHGAPRPAGRGMAPAEARRCVRPGPGGGATQAARPGHGGGARLWRWRHVAMSVACCAWRDAAVTRRSRPRHPRSRGSSSRRATRTAPLASPAPSAAAASSAPQAHHRTARGGRGQAVASQDFFFISRCVGQC